MNPTKSIICEKVQVDDVSFSKIDNNPLVDTNTCKQVMFETLDGPTRTRILPEIAHNTENTNKENETMQL